MSWGPWVERTVTLLITASAVAVAVTVVSSRVSGDVGVLDPVLVPDWEEAMTFGIPLGGPNDALATMVVLVDYQCPACRALHNRLRDILSRHPDEVQVIYVDFPLPYHPDALPAAELAGCAFESGTFPAWADAVFSHQPDLGRVSWGELASRAGIADTVTITRCLGDPGQGDRIDASVEFGRRIGLTGTPTVILEGWRYQSLPTEQELLADVERLLSTNAAR